MARIAGVDLPRDKKIQFALPYIFGIGPKNAVDILKAAGAEEVRAVDNVLWAKGRYPYTQNLGLRGWVCRWARCTSSIF